jgi:hypothetical protein
MICCTSNVNSRTGLRCYDGKPVWRRNDCLIRFVSYLVAGRSDPNFWSEEGRYSPLQPLRQYSVFEHAMFLFQFLLLHLIFPRGAFIARPVEIDDVS